MIQDLKAENEKLKNKKQLSFEEAAAVFEHKAKLLKHIQIFNKTAAKLQVAQEALNETPSLETENFTLTFSGGNSIYSQSELFKISNVEFLKDFIQFADERINKRIDELKKEIQSL